MVYINNYFGYFGGRGFGGYNSSFTPNTTINIDFGNRYPYYGGMYNPNNWMAPRPFHRTRFERFWDNFDRGMRSLAPIGLGVAGFFALFGKNGVLKNDKTKDTENGKSKVNPKDEKPKVNTSTKDSNVSSTEKDVKDKISEHAKKYFEMLSSKEYRQVAQEACKKMINKGSKYENAVMKNEDGTYTINQLALCDDKDVADAWKEAFKEATKECGYPADKFDIESLTDEEAIKELQEKYNDEKGIKTLEELGIKVPGAKDLEKKAEEKFKKDNQLPSIEEAAENNNKAQNNADGGEKKNDVSAKPAETDKKNSKVSSDNSISSTTGATGAKKTQKVTTQTNVKTKEKTAEKEAINNKINDAIKLIDDIEKMELEPENITITTEGNGNTYLDYRLADGNHGIEVSYNSKGNARICIAPKNEDTFANEGGVVFDTDEIDCSITGPQSEIVSYDEANIKYSDILEKVNKIFEKAETKKATSSGNDISSTTGATGAKKTQKVTTQTNVKTKEKTAEKEAINNKINESIKLLDDIIEKMEREPESITITTYDNGSIKDYRLPDGDQGLQVSYNSKGNARICVEPLNEETIQKEGSVVFYTDEIACSIAGAQGIESTEVSYEDANIKYSDILEKVNKISEKADIKTEKTEKTETTKNNKSSNNSSSNGPDAAQKVIMAADVLGFKPIVDAVINGMMIGATIDGDKEFIKEVGIQRVTGIPPSLVDKTVKKVKQWFD